MKKLANEELNRLNVDAFKSVEKTPIVIVLDNVRSMNNIGSAFRTADAFLVDKIYLGGITAQPPHREINKTALGATESVEWEHKENVLELVNELKSEGYIVAAVEQTEGSVSLADFQPDPKAKLCLVFGNEVYGVEQAVVDASDLCLEIPQFGTKHSLNISVSVGIVTWDIFCKIKP